MAMWPLEIFALLYSVGIPRLQDSFLFAYPRIVKSAFWLRVPPFLLVLISVVAMSTARPHARQNRRYHLLLCLVLLVAAAVAPTCVHSFPFRLQPWKQPAAQHQRSQTRRRPPGLSELFGANAGNEGSDDVDAKNDGADSKSMLKNGRSGGPAPVTSFEEMVRKMTNNPEYKVRSHSEELRLLRMNQPFAFCIVSSILFVAICHLASVILQISKDCR